MTTASDKPPQRRLVKWLIAIAILIAAFVLMRLLIATAPEIPVSETRKPATVVSVQTIRLQTLPPTLKLYGKVETSSATTLSARIEASVLAVPVEEGNRVTKGAELVRLEEQDAGLRLAQARARTAETSAALTTEESRYAADQAALRNEKSLVQIATAELDRMRELQKEGLASQAQVDNARGALEQRLLSVTARETALEQHASRKAQLEAQLASARAAEADARLDLQRSRVTAPLDGLVHRVHVSAGDAVSPGTPLVSLYDPSRLEIRAPIPTRSLARIQQALDAGTLPGAEILLGGTRLPGHLDRLSAATRESNGNLDAFIHADEASSLMRLGQTAAVILRLDPEPEVITAPFSALYGSNRVYLYEDGEMRGLQVKRVGEYLAEDGGTHLLLRSDEFRDGQLLITNQLARASDGLAVTTQASGAESE